MLLTLSQLVGQTYDSSHHHSDCFIKGDLARGVRAVVGVSCALSMIGSVLIILSYFLISDIRSKAREMLVNLSLMDFMAAAANFAGIAIDFSKYLGNDTATGTNSLNGSSHHHNLMHNLCVTQAVFAQYGTLSSIFWTICLAVYIYLCIMIGTQKVAYRSVTVFYVLCYGLPLVYTGWYAGTNKLGFDRFAGSGWCTIVTSKDHGGRFSVVFGNDIWIYLTIFLVTVIFVSLHYHLKSEMRRNHTVLAQNWKVTLQSMEMKLLFIPVFFILLRIWSLVYVVLVVEAKVHLSCSINMFFIFISGFGDSGQGFANGILYVLLTHKVRTFFLNLFLCRREGKESIFRRKTFYGSYSSAEQRRFSEDYVSEDGISDSTTVGQKDAKSLLLNT